MKKKNKKSNNDKYLCFCSKISFEKFHQELRLNSSSNLEKICEQLDLARHCAACLPNIEDEYYQLIGTSGNINKINFKTNTLSFIQRFKNFVDLIGGDKLISQYGHLPVLAANFIKTWLVISNEEPSIMQGKIAPYKIKLIFYNSNGKKLKVIQKLIYPNEVFKLCLNDYINTPGKQLKTYYVKLTRAPTSRGFRGSTRPHFYYQTNNSMSTLHIQDGSSKKSFINFYVTKNKDRNFIFIINPSKDKAIIDPNIKVMHKDKIQKEVKKKSFIIPPKGTTLLELMQLEARFENHLFECKSSIPVKCYYIIADNKLNYISVDHI